MQYLNYGLYIIHIVILLVIYKLKLRKVYSAYIPLLDNGKHMEVLRSVCGTTQRAWCKRVNK